MIVDSNIFAKISPNFIEEDNKEGALNDIRSNISYK